MTSTTHSTADPSVAHAAGEGSGAAVGAALRPLNPTSEEPLDLDDEPSDDQSPTVRALSELFGGLEVVDSALELESGTRVDWVGLDPEGDLVLVLPISGRGGSSLTAVLDLVAFAQDHAQVLRRAHARAVQAQSARLRLVAVAEFFDAETLRRLGALAPCGVELVRLGALRSARGERLYALAMGLPSTGASPPVPVPRGDDVETLLVGLPEASSERLRSVLRRLERLDDSLDVRVVRDGLAWYQGSEMLARVEVRSNGDAVGIVPGHASRPLGVRQGVELFLDEAVAAFVERTAAGEFGDGEFDD